MTKLITTKNISRFTSDFDPKNNKNKTINFSPDVSIIMGSDSDLPIMKEAAVILDYFKISYEIQIVSAHRTPIDMYEYAKNLSNRKIKVVIAGAGGSAHLPGMVASLTIVPVIGVPIKSPTNPVLGLDSLLSIVQMPSGIPVATVAINGAKNAGILASLILSSFAPKLQTKVKKFKEDMEKDINSKNKDLQQFGLKDYLKKNNSM